MTIPKGRDINEKLKDDIQKEFVKAYKGTTINNKNKVTLNEPIQEFESLEQAYKYLKEWQDRLFLNDWIIKLNFAEANEMPNNAGLNNWCFQCQSSVINIAKLTDDTKSRIVKTHQEYTLVHELLHLKFSLVENADTYEAKFLEIHEHQLIDQMAKSLIMAKYNLKYDWFRNFEV